MVKLSNLPKFRVEKASTGKTKTRRRAEDFFIAKNEAGGIVVEPRLCFKYLKTAREWNSEEHCTPPTNWPSGLHWPMDVFKAQLYSMPDSRRKHVAAPRLSNPLPPCLANECPNPKPKVPKTIGELCLCKEAPWSYRNTLSWFKANISLRHISPDVGTGTFALGTFACDTVLGEYFGELLPPSCSEKLHRDAAYVMDMRYNNRLLAMIDGARAGSWTRFINHSCAPSTGFVWKRVGRLTHITIVTEREIKKGEEITIDYGDLYWENMKEKGKFCWCGEENCKYKKMGRGAARKGKGK